MLFYFLLFMVLFCLVIAVKVRIKEAKLPKLPPPLPGKLPIIGHTHFIISDTKNLWLLVKRGVEQCVNEGGVIYAQFGTNIHYVITDPEDALTASNACLKKHFAYDFAKGWLGSGLISGSGEIHKRHRKLLGPWYTPSVINGFLDIYNSQAKKFLSNMEPHIDNGPFDHLHLVKNMILEISCLTTFGSDLVDKNLIQNYMAAIDGLLFFCTQRFQKFYLNNQLIYKLLGYQKKEDVLMNAANNLANEIMQIKKKALNEASKENRLELGNQEVQYKPFMDFMVELSMKGLVTEQEIREEVNTNVVASFETVAHTLTIITVLLGSHPRVQDKMYEEVMQVVGPGRDVDKDDLQKLVYTKAVIKESLRVFPIGPALLRAVDKDVKLKNYTLRANNHLILGTLGTHHDEKLWGPDVEEFKPERWLDPVTSAKNSVNFFGFSLGKRSCTGITYATTLMSTALAHLVRQYKWTSDYTKMKMRVDVTLKPWAGHEISIQRRK